MGQKISKIEQDAATALKVISDSATTALKVIADHAAEATKISNAKGASDHDLLIELKTNMANLQLAVDGLALRDGTYVLKEEFTFWRNLLVSGMLLTVVMGVIANFISK